MGLRRIIGVVGGSGQEGARWWRGLSCLAEQKMGAGSRGGWGRLGCTSGTGPVPILVPRPVPVHLCLSTRWRVRAHYQRHNQKHCNKCQRSVFATAFHAVRGLGPTGILPLLRLCSLRCLPPPPSSHPLVEAAWPALND